MGDQQTTAFSGDMPLVLSRDERFLVVYKPVGMATTAPHLHDEARPPPTRKREEHRADAQRGRNSHDNGNGNDNRNDQASHPPRCLVDWLRAVEKPHGILHPSSRIDKYVSGVIVFALQSSAIEALLHARHAGAYHRRYLAITTQAPTPQSGTWETTIGIDPRNPKRRVVVTPKASGKPDRTPLGAKEATTRYRTLASASDAALLAMHPITGRTHQLRVHAAHAGTPIYGDTLYGAPTRIISSHGAVTGTDAVMLHCEALTIVDAYGPGRDLKIHCPVRASFADACTRLGLELPNEPP